MSVCRRCGVGGKADLYCDVPPTGDGFTPRICGPCAIIERDEARAALADREAAAREYYEDLRSYLAPYLFEKHWADDPKERPWLVVEGASQKEPSP